MTHSATRLMMQMLEEAYRKPAWHGPNLRGTVRGMSALQAKSRAPRARHNIAEIILHCAYWKYAARRRLTNEKRGSFALKGSNWFAASSLKDQEWREFVRLLDDTHESLCEVVAALPAKRFSEIPPGAKVTNERLIYGVAMHDVYHAGQIRLIKSMLAAGK